MFSFRSINSSNYQLQNKNNDITTFRNNNISFPLYFKNPSLPINTPQYLPPIIKPEIPKLKWGEPMWNFFHVIAEKIIPEHFFIMRTDLFDIIRNICYNLPCPDCSNHARNYLNGIDFNAIITTTHLKDFFFTFHNFVNKRKELPLFEREKLDDKYKAMDLKTITIIFLKNFKDKHKSSRMIAEDLYRNKLSIKIEKWFFQNIHNFQL
jgi:hypothetical protein